MEKAVKNLIFKDLKVKILFYLRKIDGSKEIICAKKLLELFGTSKSNISGILKTLKNDGLIKMEYLNRRNKVGCQKRIFFTKEGYNATTSMMFEGMNEKEQSIIKHLNLRLE